MAPRIFGSSLGSIVFAEEEVAVSKKQLSTLKSAKKSSSKRRPLRRRSSLNSDLTGSSSGGDDVKCRSSLDSLVVAAGNKSSHLGHDSKTKIVSRIQEEETQNFRPPGISLRSLGESLPSPALSDEVEMIEAKTRDGGRKRVPKHRKGASVIYRAAHGVVSALILDVHLDDLLEPYYTIRLPDGIEKQTDNAHIMLPGADTANDDKIGAEVTADTSAAKNDTQAATDEQQQPSPASTNLNGFQYRPVTKIQTDPSKNSSANLNGFQYRPTIKQQGKGRDPEPSSKKVSKDPKSSVIIMEMSSSQTNISSLTSTLEHAGREKNEHRDTSYTKAGYRGATAASTDDFPESAKSSRTGGKFRRSKTLDTKVSSDLLRSNGESVKSSERPTRRKSDAKRPSTIEEQKIFLAEVARERRSVNESRSVSSMDQKKMLLEKERILLEKLQKEKKKLERSSQTGKYASIS